MVHVPDYQSKADPPAEPITRYVRTWHEYRKRCWITFSVMGLFPVMIVGAIVLTEAGTGLGAVAVLFFGWGLLIGVLDWWRQSIRCPRCGQRFFRRQGSVIGGWCRHCKLPKWATHNVPGRE